MVLKAVFFDMDDTLVPTSASREVRADLAVACLRQHHPDLDAMQAKARILEHGDYPWARGVEPVLRELGLLDSPAAARAIDLWFFRGCEHLFRSEEATADILRELSRSYLVGVITNGLEHRQAHKFAHSGLDSHVRVFVTSERAGARKPAREPFTLALQEAEVAAHEAVFIGDSYETDVAGSLAAGLHAAWYNPAAEPKPPGAPVVPEVTSLAQVPELVACLQRQLR